MDRVARGLAERAGQTLAPDELVALTEVLDRARTEALARWPALPDLDSDAVADAIAARVEGETALVTAVGRLALPDLLLVAAALAGDRAALDAIEQLTLREANRAVARLGNRVGADDVAQELLLKLLVATGERGPRLAAFGGHGAIDAWLKVAAVRTAISLGRREHEVAVEDEALAIVADDSDDQALAFLKLSYRAEFKAAFAATVAELPPRARTLLRLQVVDQLTLEEVGAFYRVSRATAARWLADARATLVAGTQARLIADLAIDRTELSELMRLVASTLYATLPRLLRTKDG